MLRNRTLRRVVVGVAALLFVLLGLVLVPFVVPADRFRPLIVRLAEDGTGRRVELEALRLRLLPIVHLQLMNFHIKNPPDFPAGDALVIKSMDVRMTPASLLARRLDVTQVALDGVQLNYVHTASGKSNHDFLDRLGRLAAVPPATGRDIGGGSAFVLDRVHSISVRHVKIASSTYETVTGRIVPQFAADGLDVQIGGIQFGAPNAAGAVTIAIDLRGLVVTSPALSKPVRLRDGRVTITGGAADGTFSGALDALRADAVVRIDDLRHPVVDFDVSIPELDADRLSTLVAAGKIGTLPVAGSGGPTLLAKGRFTIGRLVAGGIDGRSAAGRITVYGDRMELNAYSLSMFGGTVRGAGTLRYAPARGSAQMSAVVRGVDVAAAAKATGAAVPLGITGTLDADARITVPLVAGPPAAVRRDSLFAVTAEGTFALRDGRVPGLLPPLQIQRGTFGIRAGAVHGTFAASLGTLTAQGTVGVAAVKNPFVDFDIAVPDLDLDRVQALAADESTGPGSTGSATPGRTGGDRRLVAQGVMRVGRLRARPLEARAVTARMHVYSDRTVIDSYALSAYGGTARGTAAVDYATPRRPAQATVQVAGMDAGTLQGALSRGTGRRITGTLEGAGRFETMLVPDWLSALTGGGTFAVRNGSLPGLDLGRTFGGMAKVAPAGSGATGFRYFGGDFRIAQRRTYSEDLRVDGDGLQATGRGSAGFDGTVSYTGIATVQGNLISGAPSQLGTLPFPGNVLGGAGSPMETIGRYTARIPFSVAGTIDKPKFSAAGIPQISRIIAPAPQPQRPPLPVPSPIEFPPVPFSP